MDIDEQKTNVINLDDYRGLEEIVRRQFGSEKFVFAVINEEFGTVTSYISPDNSDLESCYLIDSLKETRRLINDDW